MLCYLFPAVQPSTAKALTLLLDSAGCTFSQPPQLVAEMCARRKITGNHQFQHRPPWLLKSSTTLTVSVAVCFYVSNNNQTGTHRKIRSTAALPVLYNVQEPPRGDHTVRKATSEKKEMPRLERPPLNRIAHTCHSSTPPS